ncbi:TonB-dependent receptor [Erythrobacter sp.]|uniref:TonB-dependent receptor n=1 Tax=Erythrobacter sp. TaxID=1042 RepID=UPI001425EF37|nr:TonB-dependent receptor [Erythrobacter sp.]QIQ86585.1 MAG: TonB-dependent receptor [Erythrobacter sp.]
MTRFTRGTGGRQASIGAIATALALVAPQAANAQDMEEAEAETERPSNTIIVTARSRAEDIQDVPIAITAFGEEDIDRRSLQELDDVARFTPGFSFEDFSGGFAQPVIRGQATTRVTALESNVSTFFDGIYIPRSWAVDLGTVNLSRIEIVKGPQSARYGRNAFSGAINYIPKKAEMTGEIDGELTATVGSDERYDGGIFINLSPVENFAIAASYNYSSFDGTWDNVHPFADTLNADGPSTTGNVGGWENEALSVSAAAEIAPGITLNASYNYFDVSQEARASRYFADSTGGILDPSRSLALEPITNAGALRFGNFPLLAGEFPDPGDAVAVDPRSFANQSETGIFRAEINAEITSDLTFNYIFGNVNGDVNIGTSGEPDPINCGTVVNIVTPLCNFQQTPVGSIDYDTHEARLTFDNSQIRASVGGFVSDGRDINRFSSINLQPITDANNFQPLLGTPVPNLNPFGPFNILLADENTRTEVVSVFGELYWTSSDGRLTLGAETRYSETEITAIDNRRAVTLNETFDEFTPRFTVEYEFDQDILLFATAARGAKAGGFNVTARRIEDRTFDPETNWTYEAGIKSAFLNGDLIFNASVFYTDWSDIQINAADEDPDNPADPNVPNITVNLGDAEVYGIELATRWQATDNFSLDATFSHTEATYGDGTVDSRFSRGVPGVTVPCDNVVCNTNGNVGGNEVERTPPTQASFGAQWDGEFGDGNSYFLRGDASWQSEFFGDSANVSIIPDRFLVNASAGLTFDDRYSVRIWARNLLDETYTSNAFIVLLPFGNTFGQFFGERRTFGATVTADF